MVRRTDLMTPHSEKRSEPTLSETEAKNLVARRGFLYVKSETLRQAQNDNLSFSLR